MLKVEDWNVKRLDKRAAIFGWVNNNLQLFYTDKNLERPAYIGFKLDTLEIY
jgi:hypothetical protein